MQLQLSSLKSQALSLRTEWVDNLAQADRFNIFLAVSSLTILCFAGIMVNGTIYTGQKLQFYAVGFIASMLAGAAHGIQLIMLRKRVPSGDFTYVFQALLIYDATLMLTGTLLVAAFYPDFTYAQTLPFLFAGLISHWAIAGRIADLVLKTDGSATLLKRIDAFLLQLSLGGAVVIGLSLVPMLQSGDQLNEKIILSCLMGVIFVVLPARLYKRGYQFLPWLWGILIAAYAEDILISRYESTVFAVAAVSLLMWRGFGNNQSQEPATPDSTRIGWPDLIMIAVIFALTIDLHFANDRHHASTYLGPINDMLHGKTLLVDSFCQYGWLVVYFFAGIFATHIIPISYTGFSLILSLMVGAAVSLVYLLIRLSVRSFRLSIVATLVIIISYVWQATAPPSKFPSLGPARFIWLYVLMAIWAWEQARPAVKRWSFLLRHLVLVVGIMWGLESAFYCAALYVLVSGYDILAGNTNIIRRALQTIGAIAIDFGAALAIIVVTTYLASGQLPDFRSNLELVVFYPTSYAVYLQSYVFLAQWLLVIAVYLVSTLVLGFKWLAVDRSQDMLRYKIVFGMLMVGLLQFSYWVANSTVISAQLLPAIYLIVYWYSEFRPHEYQKNVRQTIQFCVYMFTLVFLFSGSLMLARPTTYSVLHLAVSPIVDRLTSQDYGNIAKYWNRGATIGYVYPSLDEDNHTVRPALDLINEFAADKDRVALLIPPDSSVETLITIRKANVYRLDNAINDSLSPPATVRALQPISDLHVGDIVFLEQRFVLLLPLQQTLITNLCAQYRLEPLKTVQDVSAVRLGNLPSESGDCTCQANGVVCPSH